MEFDPLDRPPAAAVDESSPSTVPGAVRLAAAVLTLVLVFGAAGGLVEDTLTLSFMLLSAITVTVYLYRGQVTPGHLLDAAIFGCPVLLFPLWVS